MIVQSIAEGRAHDGRSARLQIDPHTTSDNASWCRAYALCRATHHTPNVLPLCVGIIKFFRIRCRQRVWRLPAARLCGFLIVGVSIAQAGPTVDLPYSVDGDPIGADRST